MFVVTVTFAIQPSRLTDFLPLMKENARKSREIEEGCFQFDVCCSGNEVFLYEVYADRAAFDEHLNTEHFQTFDAAVIDMVEDKRVTLYEEVFR